MIVTAGRDTFGYRAYLNGEFVPYCIEANDTAGYVVVVKRDGGRPMTDEAGDFVTETRWGIVRIEAPEVRKLVSG